jgi:hypothetical protein
MCPNSAICDPSRRIDVFQLPAKNLNCFAIEMGIADFRGFPQEFFCVLFRETDLFKDQHSLIAFLKLKSIVDHIKSCFKMLLRQKVTPVCSPRPFGVDEGTREWKRRGNHPLCWVKTAGVKRGAGEGRIEEPGDDRSGPNRSAVIRKLIQMRSSKRNKELIGDSVVLQKFIEIQQVNALKIQSPWDILNRLVVHESLRERRPIDSFNLKYDFMSVSCDLAHLCSFPVRNHSVSVAQFQNSAVSTL